MPADPSQQARLFLVAMAAPLRIVRTLPAEDDLSDQATATRADVISSMVAEALAGPSTSNLRLLRGRRRVLGASPLGRPAPELGPGASRLVRACIPDSSFPACDESSDPVAQPLHEAIDQAHGDEEFDRGVAS